MYESGMIRGLKPYPAYKDSGLPSLGKVPDHWQVQRQRHVLQMLVSTVDKHTMKGELPVRLCNYLDVYKNERITGSIAFMHATATAKEMERFRLRNDDVLITKDSEAWNDIGVPALVEYSAPDLVCGYHLAILRPRTGVLLGGYLLRALQSQGVAVQYHVSANGVTRYGLSHDAIKNVTLPVPSLSEQTAIMRFLNHADRRIRRYIRARQKLIALLNEQKQAIIHRAVTHALDQNVRLKASGVDWLGDVPEHWEIKRLKWVTRLQRGYDLPAQSRVAGPFPVVSSGGIIDTHSEARSTGPGVVIGRYGSTDAVFFIETDFWPHNTSLFVTNFQRNRPRWCYFMLSSISKADHSAKSAVPGIDRKDLFDIKVAVPSAAEQDAIISWVDSECAALDLAIAAVQREIHSVREYRACLIADVISGKVDAREIVTHLPQHSDEPEPLRDAEPMNDFGKETESQELDDAPEEADV